MTLRQKQQPIPSKRKWVYINHNFFMWVSACQSSIQSRIPKLTISINWCSNQMKWFWRMKIPQNLILQGRNALKVPPHQQPQSSMYKNEARGKETAATYKAREIHIRTWAGPSPFHSLSPCAGFSWLTFWPRTRGWPRLRSFPTAEMGNWKHS